MDLTDKPKDEGKDTTDKPSDSLARPFATNLGPDYEHNFINPMPGDSVISTLGEICHPSRRDNNFGCHFLILGAAIGFRKGGKGVIYELKKGRHSNNTCIRNM